MKNKAIALLCAGALLAGSSVPASAAARRPAVQSPISQSVTYQSKSLQQLYFQLLNKKVPCAPSQKPGSSNNGGSGSQKPGSGSNSGSQKPGSGSNSGSQQKPSSSNNGDSGNQKPGSGSSSSSQQKPGSSNNGDSGNQKPGSGSSSSSADSVRSQILKLVNQARAEAGLKPLSSSSALNSAAQTRAQELSQLYSHNRPDGSSCFTVLGEKGISYRTAGENIAVGYQTAQQVFNAWMNSEGHRKNILSEKFTQMGVGYTAQQGWTQLFIG